MNFASDNWAGAHPRVARSLLDNAAGFAAAYGASELDRKVERRFAEIFEREVSVFFVATGTAANALAATVVARPGGVMFAHREAHIVEDECGAPEFFSGGRMCPMDGALGRIEPGRLEAEIARFDSVSVGRPVGVSITQATEIGTVYDLDQIAAIAAVCRRHKLPLHMDGARFANALVSLGCTPAEMTWMAGVDLISFGGTKNGCWCAEALIVFNPALAQEMPYIRKRAAQLISKSRFVAAQFDAYFTDDLWLETAGHANAMAARLASVLEASGTARLAWSPQANEVFPILKKTDAEALRRSGAVFHDWNLPHALPGTIGADEWLYRFVTSFATTDEEVGAVARVLRDQRRV